MSNFKIYGCSKGTVFNYFRWITNYIFVISFAYYSNNYGMKSMHYEIGFFCTVYLTENVTYAIKYAFFHPSKLSLIERFDMNVIGDLCE